MSLPSFSPGQAVLVSLFLKKFRFFLHLPSFFPEYPVFVSPLLKKIVIFLTLSSFFPECPDFFLLPLKKNRDFFRGYPPSGVSAVAIIVHMQKIRNRSNFFQKIFHIRYIAKNSENSTAFLKKSATSGIFPKFLKTFSLFRTFFKKSFYGILWQTGHRHFNNTLCANSPNSPKLPSTGVISKITINCALPF